MTFPAAFFQSSFGFYAVLAGVLALGIALGYRLNRRQHSVRADRGSESVVPPSFFKGLN
jgi:hypothetical protein